LESAHLRSQLQAELKAFGERLAEYYDDRLRPDEKAEKMNQIDLDLRPGSHFVSFKRWIIRSNEERFAEFGHLL